MAGMQCMQITYGRCEHYDISGRLEILEQQFAWHNFASTIHIVAHYKLTKNVCHTAELTCNRITTASFARVAVIRSEWLPKIINLRPRPLYVLVLLVLLVLLKCVYSDNVRPIRRPRLWRGRDLSLSPATSLLPTRHRKGKWRRSHGQWNGGPNHRGKSSDLRIWVSVQHPNGVR